MKQIKNLDKKLNLSIMKLLEKAVLTDDYHLPVHHCSPQLLPKGLKLYRKCKSFTIDPWEALGLYVFDRVFDNKNGLYTAIYLNDRKQLAYYKSFFSKANFIIAPDYSIFDDIDERENEYRLLKIRICMLWLVLNTVAVVIPNAVYVPIEKAPEYYSGLESCSVMVFSTKGHIRYSRDRRRVKEHVKFVTDNFPNLKCLLVYSVCGKDDKSLSLFKYAADHGIEIQILENKQRTLNMKKAGVIV